jgi:hypothetical protein
MVLSAQNQSLSRPASEVSAGSRAKGLFAKRLPSEALAVAAGALLVALTPFRSGDESAMSLLVHALQTSDPPASVLVVTASPEDLRDGICARALPSALNSGGARAALILPPAGVFCGERASAPIADLPASALRVDARGDIVGFREPEALRSIGVDIASASWVIPAAPENVPGIALRDLDAGRIPLSVLQNRILVVGTETSIDSGASKNGAVTRVAAALGGLLSGNSRTEASSAATGLAALLLGGAIAFARRRYGILGALYGLGGAALLSIAVSVGLAFFASNALVPVASLLAGLAVTFAALTIPVALASKRAIARAAALLGKTSSARGLSPAADAAFWDRLAALAERAHPTDRALIAELPPRSYALELKNDRDRLFIDSRRDVRKAPFKTARGAVAPHVARGLLRFDGAPAVVVPLLAFGEIQGYLILCGERAARAFSESPERAERLSRELGRLICHRRARLEAEAQSCPGGASFRDIDRLIEHAHTAHGDLQTLSALVCEAPSALLYADAFGDIRLIGRAFADELATAGVHLPEQAGGALPAGAMSLSDLLTASGAQDPGALVSKLFDGEGGVSIGLARSARTLQIRPLRRQSDGIGYIAGYIASIVAEEAAPISVRSGPRVVVSGWEPLSIPLPDIAARAIPARKSAPPHRLSSKVATPSSVRPDIREDRLSWH